MAAQRVLRKKYRPSERTGFWRCQACGCTDRHACPGGCSWVSKKLCSSCNFTPAEVVALLAHGCSGADFVPTVADLASWTAIELGKAGRWAMAWLDWCALPPHRGAGRPAPAPAQPAFMKASFLALDKKRRPYLYL